MFLATFHFRITDILILILYSWNQQWSNKWCECIERPKGSTIHSPRRWPKVEVITPSKLSLLLDRTTSSLSFTLPLSPLHYLFAAWPFRVLRRATGRSLRKASSATFLQLVMPTKIYRISSRSTHRFSRLFPLPAFLAGRRKSLTAKSKPPSCEPLLFFLLISTTVARKSTWNLRILPN